jgi:hypothetical protein
MEQNFRIKFISKKMKNRTSCCLSFQSVDKTSYASIVKILCNAARAYMAKFNVKKAKELAVAAVQYAR